jgi:malonyl-CoA/methylmalonyl-CoA synthetase
MTSRQIPLISRLLAHPRSKVALTSCSSSTTTSYSDLLQSTALLADKIARTTKPTDRVAYLCPPSGSYVAAQLASFASSTTAVPLSTSHTTKELAYFLSDSSPSVIITQTPEYRLKVDAALAEASLTSAVTVLDYDEEMRGSSISEADAYEKSLLASHSVDFDERAMFVYTSGTTGQPKGVVTTHRALHHQITDLVTTWRWTESDRILHFLPLHHVHGIVNKLNCALYAGAAVEFTSFNAVNVWQRLADTTKDPLTIFMGVPTIYAKLLEEASKGTLSETELKSAVNQMCSHRLHVSGSAALPSSILKKWENLTGHTLLERYGMTEFGMGVGNPYSGERRLEGHVGQPFPSIEVRIIDPDSGRLVTKGAGELQVRGKIVFREYWNKPEQTAKEFTDDGWFKTGDIGELNVVKNSYRILGRNSVDIIKACGYKISALEIERHILNHPMVEEAVVVGIDNEAYGEEICCLLRLKANASEEEAFGTGGLKGFLAESMAKYKIPKKVMLMTDIPKNAMGK